MLLQNKTTRFFNFHIGIRKTLEFQKNLLDGYGVIQIIAGIIEKSLLRKVDVLRTN